MVVTVGNAKHPLVTTPGEREDDVESLRAEVAQLRADCRRHAGNVVEVCAYVTECGRHLPKMRGCAYEAGHPCACRARVAVWFPEYAS